MGSVATKMATVQGGGGGRHTPNHPRRGVPLSMDYQAPCLILLSWHDVVHLAMNQSESDDW